ncbi:hypothetical protein GCM10010517_76360 [Streptosporangium fragile]|uniref:Uncharacterized protein n=1 Tax=Streptosporangium fragile TaxID=46186 RepID=A0ABN3WB73_9ACTN
MPLSPGGQPVAVQVETAKGGEVLQRFGWDGQLVAAQVEEGEGRRIGEALLGTGVTSGRGKIPTPASGGPGR